MSKQLSTAVDAAIKKLDEGQKAVVGQKEKVMAKPVADALKGFCKQSPEFAKAVNSGGSFADCMMAVAKGVSTYISDFEAYRKAVAFYFPKAKIQMQMTIDAGQPAPAPALTPEPRKKPLVLNLADFL